MPLVKWNASRLGFVDMPAARKLHVSPVPLGGGLAVFLSVVLTSLAAIIFADFQIPRTIIGLFAGAFLLITVGFLDDIFELDYLTKLLGQVVSAMIFMAFIEQSLPLFSPIIFIVISVFWIVSLSNALNFLDNMDGLCGGITLISALAYGVLFLIKGMPMYAILSFAIAGAVLGFLKYNFTPASIFLGDAGSLFFGYSLACLSVVHISTGASMSIAGALGPIIILAYPAFDLIFVTFSRLKEGRKLYIGGKDHSSHRLNVLGVTKGNAVSIILLMNIFLVSLGILLYRFENSPLLTLGIVLIALIFSFFGAHLYKNFLFLREKITLVLSDLLSINLAFLIYFYIKSAGGNSGSDSMAADELLMALAWINAFWVVLYAVMGLYDIYFERPFKKQLVSLIKSVAAGLVIFLIANYDPELGMQISITFIVLFLLLLVFLNAVFRRLIFMVFKRRYFDGRNSLKAVVVCPAGVTPGNDSVRPFKKHYDLVGYLGNGIYKGLNKIGDIDDLTEILRNNKIARVIVDYGDGNYSDIANVFYSAYYMETLFLINDRSADNKRGFRIMPTISEEAYIISVKQRGFFATILKRLADFTFAGAALILTFPYSLYKILKARHKKIKAVAEAQIVAFGEREGKIKLDPSVAGSPYKRSWWALLSVLRGDICLYGATITTMEEYKTSLNNIPGYWKKFLVKPGLFGPGYSGKTTLDKFRLDLAYMEKTSTMGDFLMIIKSLIGFSPLKTEDLKDA
ncbi:MAG: sugar transferase [Candidatus Zixiibacteriota bacterium]|nr:MAG: sugar transferase [candidate division Zixibacteria bacterium]